MAKALSVLLIIAFFAQLVMMHVTVYSSQKGCSIEKVLGPETWTGSFNTTLEFDAPPQPFLLGAQVFVDISAAIDLNSERGWLRLERTQGISRPETLGNRDTILTYIYYCNGKYVENATWIWGVTYASGPAGPRDVAIPASAVRSGRNQLTVCVEARSIPEDAGTGFLSYSLERVQVRMTNYLGFTALFFLGIVLWDLVWKRLPTIAGTNLVKPVKPRRRIVVPTLVKSSVSGAIRRLSRVSKKKLIGSILTVVVLSLLINWIVTTPPLLPSVGEKYYTSSGQEDFIVIGSSEERIGDGSVKWAYAARAPRGAINAGSPWSYILLISKIRDNVTGPFYRGLSIKINRVFLKSEEPGVIGNHRIEVSFQKEYIAIFVNLFGTENLGVHRIWINLDYDICAILPIGHVGLRSTIWVLAMTSR